jgi:murein DD-endopeptidase MepM/ murein hydrolase activator NlpD
MKGHDKCFKKLVRIAGKAARLQTGSPDQALPLYEEMDKIWSKISSNSRISLFGDGETYRLPVSQTNEHVRPLFAMQTHRPVPDAGADDTNAVDFDVPNRTEVFSVSDGVITAIQTDSNAGGNNPDLAGKDNYIYIYNEQQNRIFCYRHVDPEPGLFLSSKVTTGMKLGLTGITGYLVTPHCHFAVYSIHHGSKFVLKSIPLYFRCEPL